MSETVSERPARKASWSFGPGNESNVLSRRRDADQSAVVEQVVRAQGEPASAKKRTGLDGVVEERVDSGERVYRDRFDQRAVVVRVWADSLGHRPDVPVPVLISETDPFGVVRRVRHIKARLLVFGRSNCAIEIEIESVADVEVAFGLDAFGVGRAAKIKDRLVGRGIGVGSVGVLEVYVVAVHIERPAVELHDRSELIGLRGGGVWRNENGAAGHIVNAGRRDRAAFGELRVGGPVAIDAIAGDRVRQRRIIVVRVRGEGRAPDAIDRSRGRRFDQRASEAQHRADVLILVEGDPVVGVLYANHEQ